jgi:hypothetical protein
MEGKKDVRNMFKYVRPVVVTTAILPFDKVALAFV